MVSYGGLEREVRVSESAGNVGRERRKKRTLSQGRRLEGKMEQGDSISECRIRKEIRERERELTIRRDVDETEVELLCESSEVSRDLSVDLASFFGVLS